MQRRSLSITVAKSMVIGFALRLQQDAAVLKSKSETVKFKNKTYVFCKRKTTGGQLPGAYWWSYILMLCL